MGADAIIKPAAIVIQTAFLGDLVLSTPVIKALSSSYRVFVIARPFALELLKNFPGVVVIPFDKDNKFLGSFFFVISKIRKLKAELLVSLHLSASSSILSSLSNARYKVGFEESVFSFVYDRKVKKYHKRGSKIIKLLDGRHEKERLLCILKDLNVNFNADEEMTLFITEDEKREAEKLIDKQTVCFAPFSVWKTKSWPRWKEFIEMADRENIKLAVLGAGRGRGEQILFSHNSNISNLQGIGLRKTMSVISICRAFVGVDTGLSHIASAFNVPTITIFGPTTPEFGFYPEGATVVQRNGLPCRPCSLHGPKVCPLKHHRCMGEIEPHEIFEIVKSRKTHTPSANANTPLS